MFRHLRFIVVLALMALTVTTPRAAAHFTTVLNTLRAGGFVDPAGSPTSQIRREPDAPRELCAA